MVKEMKEKYSDQHRNAAYEAGGIAFVGCIVLGVGFGMLWNNIPVGSIIGVGIGFIAMAVLRAKFR